MSLVRLCASLAPLALLAAPSPAQCSVDKLVDSTGGFAEHFGDRFAFVGGELFTGAPNHDGPFGGQQGAVLRWVQSGGTWAIAETIRASVDTSNTQFGYGVAVAGDHLLVGAYTDDEAGTIAGAVYAFERGGNGFAPIQKLIGSSAGPLQYAGYAVAADRDWCVVGATNLNSISDVGKAWVFRHVGGAWVEWQELGPADPTFARRFGEAVDVDDDRIVVGAPASGASTAIWIGEAYVFDFDGAAWIETAVLEAQDPEAFDGFGRAVSVDGDRILCGATGNDEHGVQSGSVYVFEVSGGVWSQTTKLVADDAEQSDIFGASVALQGDRAAIGATWEDDGGTNAGAGYLFEKQSGGWVQTHRFTAPDAVPDHQLGHWVAIEGDTVVFSAYRDATFGTQSGADYVFELGGDAANTCVSTANSTGLAARIAYTGALSTAPGSFALHAVHLPPQKSAVFFYGPQGIQVPFGNGWACVGAGSVGIFRLNPPGVADADGHFGRSVDFTAPPAGSGPGKIDPGSTWYFQCWYRDPGVGAGFNLSDGLRATFCP